MQHLPTKLCNFTNFKMLFQGVVIDFVVLAISNNSLTCKLLMQYFCAESICILNPRGTCRCFYCSDQCTIDLYKKRPSPITRTILCFSFGFIRRYVFFVSLKSRFVMISDTVACIFLILLSYLGAINALVFAFDRETLGLLTWPSIKVRKLRGSSPRW